jgi:hypothetical protein
MRDAREKSAAPIIFCNKLECSVNCERADAAAAAASIHCFVANVAAVGKHMHGDGERIA